MLVAAGAVAVLRVANAVLMATYFVPDEFWQHGEVAHLAAFGFGHRFGPPAAGQRWRGPERTRPRAARGSGLHSTGFALWPRSFPASAR